MLGNVPTNLQGMDSMQKKVWGDVQSRALTAKSLILDTNAGMLDMMVGLLRNPSGPHSSRIQVSSTYPGQSGQPPAFGEEVMTIARRI